MAPSPDEAARLARVEARAKQNLEDITDLKQRVDELERKDRQRRSDWDAERTTTFEAIKRWVNDAMTAALDPFKHLVSDVAELKSMNERQLELLKEAHEERGRRKEREERADRERKDAELALAARKVAIEEKKTDPDIRIQEKDARTRRVAPYVALAVAVIGVLGTILVALLSNK